MTRVDLIVTLIGLGMVSSGAAMIHGPSGLIVAGLGVIGLSLWPWRV